MCVGRTLFTHWQPLHGSADVGTILQACCHASEQLDSLAPEGGKLLVYRCECARLLKPLRDHGTNGRLRVLLVISPRAESIAWDRAGAPEQDITIVGVLPVRK
jgi:hypothetical protein